SRRRRGWRFAGLDTRPGWPGTLSSTSLSTAIDNVVHCRTLKRVTRRYPMPYIQFSPRRAVHAARMLAADPDDLPQVFTIIDALSIDTLERVARRLARSEAGRRLTAMHPDIVDRLADREALARLPERTLGRAYLAFVTKENISAEGIRAAHR